MMKSQKDGLPQKGTDVSAFLEEGSELQGNLNFTGVVRINGKFVGEITSTDTLIVGTSASIEGTLNVGAANIGGHFQGQLVARERIEIQKTGKVTGTLRAPAIVVHEGAQIQGELNISPSALTQGTQPLPQASHAHMAS